MRFNLKSSKGRATTESIEEHFETRANTLPCRVCSSARWFVGGWRHSLWLPIEWHLAAETEDVPSFKHKKKRERETERARRKRNWRKPWRSIKSHLLSYQSKHQIHTNDKGRRTSPTQTRGGLKDNFFPPQSLKWHLQGRLPMLKMLYDGKSPKSRAWIF